MFDNIPDFSFQNIDHFSTAGLVTRMTTDVTNVQNAYQMLIRMFVRAPIMMISALVMCVRISPEDFPDLPDCTGILRRRDGIYRKPRISDL